ncbi:MAG: L-glutamate gamma-semialdehyde dehydrogenase [Vicingaceae bacterium]
MSNGFFRPPKAKNEVVKSYKPGSPERKEIQEALAQLKGQQIEIPMFIGGKEIKTGKKIDMFPPHDLSHKLGVYHRGNKEHVVLAIDEALKAREEWSELPWEARASVFLKAAELLAGPFRAKMNAATMLCQSKNAFQAEIDAACELIDFFRFNVQFMSQLYRDQPDSDDGIWNRLEYRALEGFVFAITPFNFTSIAANLPAAPALMGNVVVWKCADSQIYSANVIMELFKEAGLPDGVINLIYTDGPEAGDVIFKHPDFAGLNFTGSTGVFQKLWQEIGTNIANYKTYPRIVGETGGKDFIVAHKSANAIEVATAITRGAFEFQGQKCSAASRAYIPSNIWDETTARVVEDVNSFKMGSPEDFGNFINAVIDERAFDKIASFIDYAKGSSDSEIIAGGNYNKEKGYFIEPTVIVAKDPKFKTMCEEIFGPVITLYRYDENKYEETLKLVDSTSPYALTGAIFAKNRFAVDKAVKMLKNSAGNFYINDKPTGAVVGQQPFGGARASGTNDKAGAMQNLLRWVSSRTIKETFVPAVDYRYPFLES